MVKNTELVEENEPSLLDLLQFAAGNLRLPVPGYSFTTLPFFPLRQQQSGAAVAMRQGLGALGGWVSAVSGIKGQADQYVAFLQSSSAQDARVDRFKLMARLIPKFHDPRFRENAKLIAELCIRVLSAWPGIQFSELTKTCHFRKGYL